jgi:hypothetical protein
MPLCAFASLLHLPAESARHVNVNVNVNVNVHVVMFLHVRLVLVCLCACVLVCLCGTCSGCVDPKLACASR